MERKENPPTMDNTKKEKLRVRITQHVSKFPYWYKNRIGHEYAVRDYTNEYWMCVEDDSLILKSDCIIIPEPAKESGEFFCHDAHYAGPNSVVSPCEKQCEACKQIEQPTLTATSAKIDKEAQAEEEKETLHLLKDIATKFFFYWWNKPGANTYDGFDEWANGEGKYLIESLQETMKSEYRYAQVELYKNRIAELERELEPHQYMAKLKRLT